MFCYNFFWHSRQCRFITANLTHFFVALHKFKVLFTFLKTSKNVTLKSNFSLPVCPMSAPSSNLRCYRNKTSLIFASKQPARIESK